MNIPTTNKITITAKLAELGFEFGKPVLPVANYVQAKITPGMIFIAGQMPFKNGEIIYKGKVGKDLSIEDGKKAAELALVNILSHLVSAVDDDMENVKSCIKLEISVNCESNFERHSEIANGASDLLVKVLGERGKHIRTAVGACSLPLNSAVEVSAIFQTEKQDME